MLDDGLFKFSNVYVGAFEGVERGFVINQS